MSKRVKPPPNNVKEFLADSVIKYLEERDDELHSTRLLIDDWIIAATLKENVFACYNCKCVIYKDKHLYYKCMWCNNRWCCDCNAGITNHNIITDCPNNDRHCDDWCDPNDCFLSFYYKTITSVCSSCLTTSAVIKIREINPKCKCLSELRVRQALSRHSLNIVDE